MATETRTDTLDNKTYQWFTFAHEVGHALGLVDEYIEGLDTTDEPELKAASVKGPKLTQFFQYERGFQYIPDRASIMNNNAAPRLRHYWPYAKWVNENADVQSALMGRRCAIEYARPAGIGSGAAPSVLRFSLPVEAADFYDPIAEEKDFRAGGRHMQLQLYRIPQDESPWGNLEPSRRASTPSSSSR